MDDYLKPNGRGMDGETTITRNQGHIEWTFPPVFSSGNALTSIAG